MHRINFLGLKLLVVFSLLLAPLQSSYADDLSTAQTKLKELQKIIDLDNNYLNVEYTKNLDQTNQCIVKFTNAQEPEDQTKHNLCVTELERLQLDRERRVAQIALNTAEISKLTVEIAKLESSTQPSAGAATIQPGQSAVTPTPGASPSPVISPTPTSSVTPSATPAPSTSSPTASTPTTTPSASPTPSTVQKATPAPKPVVKKKTITCVKGKTVRKVTAVKPVCPKGFKVQKTK
jgi:hypothetical protein